MEMYLQETIDQPHLPPQTSSCMPQNKHLPHLSMPEIIILYYSP